MLMKETLTKYLLKFIFLISIGLLLMSEDCSETSNPLRKAVLAPNPASDHITLIFEVSEECEFTIGLFDVNGSLILQKEENTNFQPGEHRLEFNLATLPSGIYFCRLNSEQINETLKFTIAK